MQTEWPSLNSRAWLRLRCCGAEHPTRVEGFTENGCILATPSLPHKDDVDPEVAKDGFFIGWVAIHQALEMPLKLVEHTQEPLPTWTVESAGDPAETQRRNYVRLALEFEVDMALIPGGAQSHASTDDLSEGGFKCIVDEWAPDPHQRLFNVTLYMPDQTFVIPAQVAWWGRLDERNRRPVGVQFRHDNQKTADTIRSFIFAKQLEQRRRQNS